MTKFWSALVLGLGLGLAEAAGSKRVEHAGSWRRYRAVAPVGNAADAAGASDARGAGMANGDTRHGAVAWARV